MPSTRDFATFSGLPAAGDALYLRDDDASHPQDRQWPFSDAHLAFGVPVTVTASAPTTGDDSADGFRVGHQWLDTSGPTLHMCTDATEGNAVWRVVADWS